MQSQLSRSHQYEIQLKRGVFLFDAALITRLEVPIVLCSFHPSHVYNMLLDLIQKFALYNQGSTL